MEIDKYIRAAKVIKIIDGDTIDVDIDVGYHLTIRQRLRFARINAPELSTAEGQAAKAYVISQLDMVPNIIIQTHKNPADKYGRWLAEIWLDTGQNLNDLMLSTGHAVVYHG
jgi:micrococcal nuclease